MQFLRMLSEFLTRLFGTKKEPGDWPDTVGPEPDEMPILNVGEVLEVVERSNHGEFTNGKWSLADYREMHAGRIGRGIVPQTLIVHTTDMRPGTFQALVRGWTTGAGRGNGAHFLIGRTQEDGVVQFAPITRNANHAGGTNPGAFKLPSGGTVHPNACSVGVELDNAGRLIRSGSNWIHPDTKTVIPDADVYEEYRGPGKVRGWHAITDYQRKTLEALWNALKPTLKPWPAGTVVAPNASYASQGVPFASAATPSLIGHISLNPIRKTDPGPEVMAMIKGWS